MNFQRTPRTLAGHNYPVPQKPTETDGVPMAGEAHEGRGGIELDWWSVRPGAPEKDRSAPEIDPGDTWAMSANSCWARLVEEAEDHDLEMAVFLYRLRALSNDPKIRYWHGGKEWIRGPGGFGDFGENFAWLEGLSVEMITARALMKRLIEHAETDDGISLYRVIAPRDR